MEIPITLVSEKAGVTSMLFGTTTDPETGTQRIKSSVSLGNGIEIKLWGGGMRTASMGGVQTDSVIIVIAAVLGSIKYGIDIAKFFNEKLRDRSDVQVRIGDKSIPTKNKDELQKAIDEEIDRRAKEGKTK